MTLPLDIPALTQAIRRGDNEAFGHFYEFWFDRVYAKARRLSRRDEGFCLDIVQDAFLKAARSMKPMQTEQDLERWISRLVHTTVLDRLKAERRLRNREQRASREETLIPTDTMEFDERLFWIQAELDDLSQEERALLESRFGRGETLKETGAQVGLTPFAAHGRIRRLLQKLQNRARETFHVAL